MSATWRPLKFSIFVFPPCLKMHRMQKGEFRSLFAHLCTIRQLVSLLHRIWRRPSSSSSISEILYDPFFLILSMHAFLSCIFSISCMHLFLCVSSFCLSLWIACLVSDPLSQTCRIPSCSTSLTSEEMLRPFVSCSRKLALFVNAFHAYDVFLSINDGCHCISLPSHHVHMRLNLEIRRGCDRRQADCWAPVQRGLDVWWCPHGAVWSPSPCRAYVYAIELFGVIAS